MYICITRCFVLNITVLFVAVVAVPVLAHRLIPLPETRVKHVSGPSLNEDILTRVPVPTTL